MDQRIYSVTGAGSGSDTGALRRSFDVEDADKIRAWLLAAGAVEVEGIPA